MALETVAGDTRALRAISVINMGWGGSRLKVSWKLMKRHAARSSAFQGKLRKFSCGARERALPRLEELFATANRVRPHRRVRADVIAYRGAELGAHPEFA